MTPRMTSHRLHPHLPPRAGRLVAGATLSLALATTLAACGDDDGSDASDGATASDSPTSGPSTTPSSAGTDSAVPTTSPTEASSGATTVAVPVYFLGDSPQGPRLFREFRQVPAADPVDEALAIMASGQALDPDYRSSFPTGSPTVSSQDETIEVQLPNDSWVTRPAGMTTREARLAVQQLVYTVQGASQLMATVGFTAPGSADSSPTVLGLDTAGGFERAPELDVLALVDVTTPEQGATVSGSFTAEGLASSFEGTVDWEVRAADGTVAAKGFATAEGYIDKLYPWTTQVDLSGVAPGDYTFAALTDDPSAGTEGPGPSEDTKAITVQ